MGGQRQGSAKAGAAPRIVAPSACFVQDAELLLHRQHRGVAPGVGSTVASTTVSAVSASLEMPCLSSRSAGAQVDLTILQHAKCLLAEEGRRALTTTVLLLSVCLSVCQIIRRQVRGSLAPSAPGR